MLRVVVAEDDSDMRLILKKIVEEVPGVKVIGEAENGAQLIQLAEDLVPDVIFVDVDMPKKSGSEAAKEIFNKNLDIFIVFATAYNDYMHEAFEVYAFDYLIKPFKVERIRQTVARINEIKRGNSTPTSFRSGKGKLLIRSSNNQLLVNIRDIILVTRSDRKTILCTIKGAVKAYEPLENLWERLKEYNFFRCHRGYIINVDMVTEVSPWGNKTYLVRFENTDKTALMTLDKAKEFRSRYR